MQRDAHLVGDDAGEGGLAEPRRAGEQQVVDRLLAPAGRLEDDRRGAPSARPGRRSRRAGGAAPRDRCRSALGDRLRRAGRRRWLAGRAALLVMHRSPRPPTPGAGAPASAARTHRRRRAGRAARPGSRRARSRGRRAPRARRAGRGRHAPVGPASPGALRLVELGHVERALQLDEQALARSSCPHRARGTARRGRRRPRTWRSASGACTERMASASAGPTPWAPSSASKQIALVAACGTRRASGRPRGRGGGRGRRPRRPSSPMPTDADRRQLHPVARRRPPRRAPRRRWSGRAACPAASRSSGHPAGRRRPGTERVIGAIGQVAEGQRGGVGRVGRLGAAPRSPSRVCTMIWTCSFPARAVAGRRPASPGWACTARPRRRRDDGLGHGDARWPGRPTWRCAR